jgi:uncharacterized membrane protein SirB2
VAPEINLFIHILGFGLLVTPLFSGILLEIQLRRAKDAHSQLTVARSLRSIGILSPIAMAVMLITGIGNMQMKGYSMMQLPGWLAFKIVAFVLVILSGVMFMIQSRRRSAILRKRTEGIAEGTGDDALRGINRQVLLAYCVLFLLILVIVFLSVAGVAGAF